MLRQDLSGRSLELRAGRVPFVHARVTLAEAPTSAKPGDEAIIRADGAIEGFVGGLCAESTVREAAADLLASGAGPVVLRVTPEPEPDQPGKQVVHNACLSGGTIEIFLEPAVPPPLVVVVGRTPIARALATLGAGLRWAVQEWDGELPLDAVAVVVASHGRGEEEALTAALERGVAYVGLVASRRRGAAVVAGLQAAEELRARVHTPAGLDLAAGTAEEVALSILAEIVGERATRAPAPVALPPAPAVERAVDPVCGMTVFPEPSTPVAEHAGRTVWFCGRGCRDAFVADPAAYAA